MTTFSMAELYASGPEARELLRATFGRELPAKVAHLEAETARLLADELPEADPAARRDWAHRLAFVVATDPWFAKLGTGVTPGRVAGALNRAARAGRELQKALNAWPEAAAASVHLLLLELDLPSGQEARQRFLGESVLGTRGGGEAGLPVRRGMLAELLLVTDAAHESWRGTKAGKPRADRLARHAADAFEALTGEPAPVSGSGGGSFYRILEHLLSSAGLDNDVSAGDVGRREAEARRGGKIRASEPNPATTAPGDVP